MPERADREGIDDVVARMARREAAANFRLSTVAEALRLRPEPCPSCRADGWDGHARDWAEELPAVELLPAGEPGGAGPPVLVLLSCELLAPRSLLLVSVAIRRFPAVAGARFETRAVSYARRIGARGDERSVLQAVRRVDRAERWTDGFRAGTATTAGAARSAGDPERGHGPGVALTVPTSTRLRTQDPYGWPGHRSSLAAHFLTPHPRGRLLTRLNDRSLAARLSAARAALTP